MSSFAHDLICPPDCGSSSFNLESIASVFAPAASPPASAANAASVCAFMPLISSVSFAPATSRLPITAAAATAAATSMPIGPVASAAPAARPSIPAAPASASGPTPASADLSCSIFAVLASIFPALFGSITPPDVA